MSKRFRLDRYLAKTLNRSIKSVRVLLSKGDVTVDGEISTQPRQQINEFNRIVCEGQVLQALEPAYLMFNKPAGVVCATKDDQHKTVIDLIDHPLKHTLHIVGRLDLNSTGLVLLTNDGRWSRALTQPNGKVEKVYSVTVKNPITPDYIQAFAEGMYFNYEDITTAPVTLTIHSDRQATLVLTEGRYHQIKRMFGRFRNAVLTLHRSAIGNYTLPEDLAEGDWREVKPDQTGLIHAGPINL